MPHTRSAAKNLRKGEKRRAHNRATKSTIKTEIKKFQAAIASGSLEDAKKEFVVAVKKLDKAAVKRVIHPNMASRKKSQLQRLLNQKVSGKPARRRPPNRRARKTKTAESAYDLATAKPRADSAAFFLQTYLVRDSYAASERRRGRRFAADFGSG